MKNKFYILLLSLLVVGLAKAVIVPPPLISARGGASGGGGSGVWYDSTTNAASYFGISSSFQEWDPVITSTTGTATKLRVRARGGLSDQTIKVAVYSNDGATLHTNGVTGTIAASSSDAWHEINLGSGLSLSSGTYQVAVSASGTVDIKIFSGSGGNYSAQSYAGFPVTPLPSPAGSIAATIQVGIFIE